MVKLLNRMSRSINNKLFVPLLLVFIVAVVFFYTAVVYRTEKLVDERLHERAYELAESFAVATEINTSESNFVRVINSIGAYDDIKVLFLLDDDSAQVIASSKNRYRAVRIADITAPELKNQLSRAIALHHSQFLDGNSNQHKFVYKMQTIATDKASLRAVTLVMEIDTSSSEAYVASITLYFFSGLLGLLAVIVVTSYFIIRLVILKPIYQLVHSIKQTKRLNKPVVSRYQSYDQLGALTKVYNELILDSFNKQRELTSEREKSEAALQAKSQFLAMMTHELRTPLNGVIGMSAKLSQLVQESKQQKYLDVIQLSANQLLNIINDTLDFSKIEADKLVMDIQPFDLVETVRSVVAMFELQIEHQPLTLSLTEPQQHLPILLGDNVRVIQVLINLLGNAVKFTESGSVDVAIKVISQNEQQLQFSIGVQDSGIGLSECQIKSLFTEFSQADSSTTRKYGGTGLGLWISKKLIEKMDGQIKVNGQLGVGAEFIVELQLDISPIDAVNEVDEPADVDALLAQMATINILLVEDTEINRQVVIAILDLANVRIRVAENGLEAVKLFQAEDFDLILMDCLMPVMDGFDASREIRQIEQLRQVQYTTPIIALTANALDETRQQCLEAGMDEFLTKPVVPEQLKAIVAKWLGSQTVDHNSDK